MDKIMITIRGVANGWIVQVVPTGRSDVPPERTLVFNDTQDMYEAIDELYDEYEAADE